MPPLDQNAATAVRTRFKHGSQTMMRKSFAVLLVLLGGCAARPPIEIDYYEPPHDGLTATIVGEESVTVPLLFDNNTIFVEIVDYRRVRDARNTGKTPLTIAAGNRHVMVAQQLGSFSGGYSFDFEARAGVAYRVRYQQDIEGTGLLSRPLGPAGGPTLFWIEELESGTPVTEKARTYVRSDYKSSPIPIFVPKSR